MEGSRYRFWKDEKDDASRESRAFARNADEHDLPYPLAPALMLAEDEERNKGGMTSWMSSKLDEDPTKMLAAAQKEFEVATNEMVNAWNELQESIPGNQGKAHIAPQETMYSLTMKFDRNDETGKTGVSRVKKVGREFCSELVKYSDVFKFIPSGDKYVSIVTGTMSTIIEASARYIKIGDAFIDGTETIRAYMLDIKRIVDLCETEDMIDRARLQANVAGVFTVILKFLILSTRWCRSKFERFKNSFKKDYDLEVKTIMSNLVDRMARLDKERSIHAHKIGIETRDILKRRFEREEKYKQRQIRQGNELEAKGLKQLEELLQIGRDGIALNTLQAERQRLDAERLAFEQQARDRIDQMRKEKVLVWWQRLSERAVARSRSLPAAEMDSPTMKALEWHDVEAASAHLEALAETGFIMDETFPGDIQISPEVTSRLHEWISADGTQWLWLCSPGQAEQPSEASLAALYITILCERLNLILICYKLRSNDLGLPESSSVEANTRSLEMDRFTLMMYSVIRQLACSLPEKISGDIDFQQDRFLRLDGSTTSLLDAFNLVEELLSLTPEPVVCVFDGFQLIDNDIEVDGTHGHLNLFIDLFRESGLTKKLKVLLCSDGLCRSLLDEETLNVTEQMHIGAEEHELSSTDLLPYE